jgi:uncharacterized protein (DUF2235 family)
MSKLLIVCCDGTWNTPDQQGSPTNVTKMARALAPRAPDGTVQLVYYHEGVGTGNRLDRFLGGALGMGLGQNVQQAYRFLALNYEPGDRLAFFGFSRGAFTVRSLAGLVNLVGILRKGDLDKMPDIWSYYRTKPEQRSKPIDPRWIADRPGVDLLGVWDTVGSLGIPSNMFGKLGRRRYEFHDVKLGATIRRAYQALAIDEHRRSFLPAVWDTTHAAEGQEVDQTWFVGAHSNVGGGYPDPTLSDQAFLWMVNKARLLIGFDEDYIERRIAVLKEDQAAGLQVDSCEGWWQFFGRAYRLLGEDASESLHPSVLIRRNKRDAVAKGQEPYTPYPYRSPNLEAYLAKRGLT